MRAMTSIIVEKCVYKASKRRGARGNLPTLLSSRRSPVRQ